MADPRLKQIKIKTGVVRRLTKEKAMYEKEVVAEEKKAEKMKAEGRDEYEVNKQLQVLDESKMMVPDTMRRLKTSAQELKTMLENEADLVEAEEYKQAQEVLTAAEAVVA